MNDNQFSSYRNDQQTDLTGLRQPPSRPGKSGPKGRPPQTGRAFLGSGGRVEVPAVPLTEGNQGEMSTEQKREHPSAASQESKEGRASQAARPISGNGALDGGEEAIQRQERTSIPRVDAVTVWQSALSELALQMPTATYETWVRDTSVIAYEDGEFIVGVPNAYARDWLANRLRTNIKRTLSKILCRSVQVTFRVRPRPNPESEASEMPPLYQTSNETGDERDEQTDSERQGTDPAHSIAHQAGSNRSAHPSMHAPGQSPTPGQDRGANRRPPVNSTPLNQRYTFDSFVVGNHNRLAHAAALSVADHPGQRFNPLFVYGGVGLGKTHLLHAIGNQMLTRRMQVLYCSSEQFTNDLITAIRNQSTEEFRNKYRQVDLLLIDDIQFIGGKESTQEEFFHTFNHLHAAGRQVVISSDRPPKEIATLEARLRSRFEGGLQADISQPDLETRVAILQSKAAAMNTSVPMEVLMLIAERVENNIRELEGALNRLIMQAPLYESGLNRQMAEEILNNLMPQRRPRDPSSIIRIVAEHFGLAEEDLTGRVRTKEIAGARQVAMYLLRQENELSLPNIGELLGGRDHSTIRYGVEKIENEMDEDEALRQDVVELRDKIYAPPGSY